MLQAPVSFRVVGAGLAHLQRTVAHLDAAIERALSGVTTSPALVDGRFLGTTGFHAIDLGACADAVRQAVLHVAETGAARMHRLLDPRVSGLPPQLSSEPGRQAGMVALHKRVVGLLHQARRTSAPAALGAADTSSGQEDVQVFALEAMRAASDAAAVLRDVTSCELLCLHRATLLDEEPPRGSERLRMVLHKGFEHLPDSKLDRPFGREMTALAHLLGVGWALDVLDDLPTPTASTCASEDLSPDPALLRREPDDHVRRGDEGLPRTALSPLTTCRLELPTGEITVFVGPSGCGKTTSLRMINRTIEPTSGTISIDGEDVTNQDAALLRRKIGYVIQQAGLFPHRTIVDNIATVPLLNGVNKKQAREQAAELLTRVGLDESMATRYPNQLSGGQQQRVGVARALAADPPVMLMDEPFSAVDPIVRDGLQQEFLRLQSELGKTIAFVTHDIDEAIKLGDKVAIFRVGGHLAQVGAPQDLLDDPADEFVADFVGRDRGFRAPLVRDRREARGRTRLRVRRPLAQRRTARAR